MEAIRELIEWVGNDSGSAFATIFPYLLLGLAGLYVLWIVLGYVRVSQVGATEDHEAGRVVQLPRTPEGSLESAPRGVPYCEFDGLQYPHGARFCTACERDLRIDCSSCGATLRSADTSCYRCGTPTGTPEQPLLT
jgi:hypothetical protein